MYAGRTNVGEFRRALIAFNVSVSTFDGVVCVCVCVCVCAHALKYCSSFFFFPYFEIRSLSTHTRTRCRPLLQTIPGNINISRVSAQLNIYCTKTSSAAKFVSWCLCVCFLCVCEGSFLCGCVVGIRKSALCAHAHSAVVPRSFCAGTCSTATLHRVTSDWGEGASSAVNGAGASALTGDSTWLRTFYDTVSWGTNGGDYIGVCLCGCLCLLVCLRVFACVSRVCWC